MKIVRFDNGFCGVLEINWDYMEGIRSVGKWVVLVGVGI